MSGICGVLHFDDRPGLAATLSSMVAAAPHRGPDGERTWQGRGVGLAHLALHVTSEDAREQQPLAQDSLVIVADARIDNRTELRSQLRGTLRTSTPTDAEFILAAYRRWGRDCARHLIGDFAFAIWDNQTRRLFAARDPMGMRALYYRAESDRFLFATELGQLRAAVEEPLPFDDAVLAAYAMGHFEETRRTFFDGLWSLAPAHSLEVDATGVRERRYWDVDPARQLRYADERDYIAQFREVFIEAVRCRLRGPRPAGLLLSGGVDSTSIAIAAGWLQEQGEAVSPLHTYSFRYRTLTECDERFVSDPIVVRFGLPSTVIDVESIPLIAREQDPPLEQPYVSAFHHLLLDAYEQAKNQGASVMLSGHRGDLMVGGWIFDYPGLLQSGRWRRLGRELRSHAQREGVGRRQVIREHLTTPLMAHAGDASVLTRGVQWWRALRGYPETSPSAPSLPKWFTPVWNRYLNELEPSGPSPEGFTGARAERYQLAMLGGHMLGATRNDFDCARSSLASADPWSDRRLFEFIMSIPQHLVCRAGENKWIVRKALEGMMEGVGARKITPESLYLRALRSTEKETVWDLLGASQLEEQGVVDGATVRRYYDLFLNGTASDYRFWYTLVLERWLRQQNVKA